MIDFHSHILPGIDDGSKDWDQSLKMAEMAADDGISGIVCTPHWSPVFPENNRETILEAVGEFRERLRGEGIGVEVYPGAELVIDFHLPEKIKAGELLSINDSERFALVEVPFEVIPPDLERLFWGMQILGITPVLAHPERSRLLPRSPFLLDKWMEAGALVQITAASLCGYFGFHIRDFSVELLRRRAVAFIATDAHDCEMRRPVLSEARAIVETLVGPQEAHRIFHENPSRALRGELPELPEILPPESRKGSFFRKLFAFHS